MGEGMEAAVMEMPPAEEASIPIIQGQERKISAEQMMEKCSDVVAFLELSDVEITGVGIEPNNTPVLEVKVSDDQRGHIRYYGKGSGVGKSTRMGHEDVEADFDPTPLGIAAEKNTREMSDYWVIDIDQL